MFYHIGDDSQILNEPTCSIVEHHRPENGIPTDCYIHKAGNFPDLPISDEKLSSPGDCVVGDDCG